MRRLTMDELDCRLADGLQLDSPPPPVGQIAEQGGRRRRRHRVLSAAASVTVVVLVTAGVSTVVRTSAPPHVVVTSPSPQPSTGTVETTQSPAFSVDYDIAPPDEPWGEPPFRFHPATRQDDGKTVMPVVYPNGARADLAYDPQIRLAETGLFVHFPGLIYDDQAPPLLAQGYRGPMEEVVTWKYGGQPLRQVAAPTDGNGAPAAVWNIPPQQIINNRRDVIRAQVLSVQLGTWTLLVDDVRYRGGPAGEGPALAELASLISGGNTPDGFLYLRLEPPLQAAVRGHAQQSGWLAFGAASAGENDLRTYVGCNPSWRATQGEDGFGEARRRCDDSGRLAFEVVGDDTFASQTFRSIEARNISVPPDVYLDRWIDQNLYRLYVDRYGQDTPSLIAAFQHIDDYRSMNVVGHYLSRELPTSMTVERRLELTIDQLRTALPPPGGGNPLGSVAPRRTDPTVPSQDDPTGNVSVHIDNNTVTVMLPDWAVYEPIPVATNVEGEPPPNQQDAGSGQLALEQLAATIALHVRDVDQIVLDVSRPVDPGELIFGVHPPGEALPNDGS